MIRPFLLGFLAVGGCWCQQAEESHDSGKWRANYQATYVWQGHGSFPAAYDGPNSLQSARETGYTLTATVFFGFRPWRGGELFFNPEMIQSMELSGLHGLGGLTNAENQKTGGPVAKVYHARAFLRQTFDLGGAPVSLAAAPNQFETPTSGHRLVLSVGQMSVSDIFDNNAYAHDGRTQFLNWSFLTHAASDYAADARGYSYGAALEYYRDRWAFRFGRFAQPQESNGLPIDFSLSRHYGDSAEIEHAHSISGHEGKLRLLGFRNRARMAKFADALELAHPDLAPVRKPNSKYGFGLALEQSITRDAGVFARYSWNDGRTETYAFTEIERSLTAGLAMKGRRWRRPGDTLGLAFARNGISKLHQAYLAAGGLGAFIGDGRLNYRAEGIFEVYYAIRLPIGSTLTGDYQRIANPAYNRDRGPVSVASVRLHWER